MRTKKLIKRCLVGTDMRPMAAGPTRRVRQQDGTVQLLPGNTGSVELRMKSGNYYIRKTPDGGVSESVFYNNPSTASVNNYYKTLDDYNKGLPSEADTLFYDADRQRSIGVGYNIDNGQPRYREIIPIRGGKTDVQYYPTDSRYATSYLNSFRNKYFRSRKK